MKVYKVGGSVRDTLLGLTPKDHDYVIVGATPAQMESMGYSQVGKDFPVFLHPETHDEYALARTERKTGFGHTDFETVFDSSITIEDDLLRRDLTINAIAVPFNFEGEPVDPFHGMEDLKNKVLRHVSPAFSEDPLRVLRVARFAARFPDFTIAPETLALMKEMVAAGDLDHLPSERLWAELHKAMLSPAPLRYLEVMHEVNALGKALMYYESRKRIDFYEGKHKQLFNALVEDSESLEDHDKVMVRLSFIYKIWTNWNLYGDPALPLEVKSFTSQVFKFAYSFAERAMYRAANYSSIMDAMNIRNMVQRIPNFVRNFLLVAKHLYPASYFPAIEVNLKFFEACAPEYFNTKIELKQVMEQYLAENGKNAPPMFIQEALTRIRIAKMVIAMDNTVLY